MNGIVLQGIMLPFVGTTAGAACVFFMKEKMTLSLRRALTGFADHSRCAGSRCDDVRR